MSKFVQKLSFKGLLNNLKTLGQFLITKRFLLHVGLSIVAAFVFLFLVFRLLSLITHHGQGLSVPDFTGLSLKEAVEVADDHDIRIEVNDSVYNAPGKKGTIIDQTPPPDFKVKEDRTIHVVIKTFNPERIKIPDFTGVSLIQAKADIETYGLKIGKLKYIPDIATNNVLEQMYKGKPISPGTLIEKNSRIDLVLGMGKSDKVTLVPSLLGLNRSTATQKITDNSLNVGAMIFDEMVITTEDSAMATIWKQKPVKNAEVAMGSPVDVWLSLDPEKTEEEIDNDTQ